jgi:uncharacterized membrane protein YvlD (DUF360 family)
MADFYNNTDVKNSTVLKLVVRFIAAAVILAITAFLTPGFAIEGLFPLLLSAIIISVLDYALSKMGLDATPFGRGITGFILAAAVIYFTQFFIAGFTVTVMGALIGALVYGVVDALLPGKAM